MACWNHLVVGIFSREDRSTYDWLIRTVTFTCGVKDVQPVLITNNWQDFEKEVPKCSFGILYHSQSRGRLNIANVTDSLYDDELQYLAAKYGRENVLVVVGDVEDNSDEKKAAILREQSLCNYAQDLFLFNEIKGNMAPFQRTRMKDLASCIKTIALWQFLKKSIIWLIFLLVVFIIVIIVVSVRSVSHPGHQSTLSPLVNVTNVTFHSTSYDTTTPLSTTAKITSSFTSQMMNTTTQQQDNTTSTENTTKNRRGQRNARPKRRAGA